MVMLICRYFRATYGSSIDLFAGLSTPIVERFKPADELGSKLQAALAEISGRQVGMQAMTTAIRKQVLACHARPSESEPAQRLGGALSYPELPSNRPCVRRY